VTAVVDAYLKEVVEEQTARRQQRLDQLKEIAVKYEERLKRIQQAKNEVAKTIGSSDEQFILLKRELAQKQAALVKEDLLKVDADLRRMQFELRFYGTAEDKDRPADPSVKPLDKDKAAALKQQIAFNREYKKVLSDEIERLVKELPTIENKVRVLGGADMEVSQAQAGYNRALEEIDKLTVNASSPSRVRKLEDTVVRGEK
jgi:hypothetical protein